LEELVGEGLRETFESKEQQQAMVFTDRVLVEKDGVHTADMLISILSLLCLLLLKNLLVLQIQIEHNLLLILFDDVTVHSTALEHTQRVFKVLFEKVVLFVIITE
jgi:hypothetical protein